MSADRQKEGIVRPDEWVKSWSIGYTPFHKENIHESLQKHIDPLINGRENIKIFVPLCGKDVSMKWLYDLGHTVIGVDVAEKAFQEFFKEQNLQFVVEQKESFKLYKSEDGRMMLFCGDVFKFNSSYAGKVGGVWDRGSLVAINADTRTQYRDLVVSLLEQDARYLLETFVFNGEHTGPPHYLPKEELEDLFSPFCKIEQIDYEEREGTFTRRIHLLKPKLDASSL